LKTKLKREISKGTGIDQSMHLLPVLSSSKAKALREQKAFRAERGNSLLFPL
jgi:hypothetical protein